ncbi:hypothetical protein OJ253_2005 [Cryptosporidium canis]|uniref:Uncharacterized protein n=1 Tax=Cryptosporidium canis TaxID=195482 RepID=A0A9D5DFV1_9CRYT|nr:hypothetical protein OJ253_2005 [Cryptosporidium canis]
MTDRKERPLTRGQRKRRQVLERVQRKQDLASFLLMEKQLQNVTGSSISRKRCYSMSKLRHEIMKSLESDGNKQDGQQQSVKNKSSRKKVQSMRESSMDFFKDVLQHPDFNNLDDIKSRLIDRFENGDQGQDKIISIAKRPKKQKPRANKSVKVAKSIQKR